MAQRGRPVQEEKAMRILVKGTEQYARRIKAEAAERGLSIAEYTRYLLDMAREIEAKRQSA